MVCIRSSDTTFLKVRMGQATFKDHCGAKLYLRVKVCFLKMRVGGTGVAVNGNGSST